VDAKGASLAIIASPLYMLGLGPQLKTECIAIAKYLVTLLDKQPKHMTVALTTSESGSGIT
jgi:hypothetical protein